MTDPVAPEQPVAAQPPLAAQPSFAPKRTNVVGIVAFVVGVIAFLSPAIAVVVGFGAEGNLPSLEGLDFFTTLIYGAVGAGVGCAVGLLAIVLGIVSLVIRNAKRLWGILGLVLGVIAVLVGWIPLLARITSGGSSGPTGVPLNG